MNLAAVLSKQGEKLRGTKQEVELEFGVFKQTHFLKC